MSTVINSDEQLRRVLDGLDSRQQREVAALFVDSVLELSGDTRLTQALAVARSEEPDEMVIGQARRIAKSASLDAHARCGADGEWTDQAGYFVARAVEACLEPDARAGAKGVAWKAAMSARMARTCLAANGEVDSHDSESQAQYKILSGYLDA